MAAKDQEQVRGNQLVQQIAPAIPGSPGLLDTLLELGGALTLRDALAAWQHEQDRLLNRSWRRPGGLARPAGL